MGWEGHDEVGREQSFAVLWSTIHHSRHKLLAQHSGERAGGEDSVRDAASAGFRPTPTRDAARALPVLNESRAVETRQECMDF